MASTYSDNSSKSDHLRFLRQAIDLARLSPSKPTNFRVGCVIVSRPIGAEAYVMSSGYTLELEGNTHAEQCALSKLADRYSIPEQELNHALTFETNTTLYTSLEPCGKRLSGNLPCVQRIIATRQGNEANGIRKVVFGAQEPGTFVQDSQSCKLLSEAGIEWQYISDLEDEILKVAMEGHQRQDDKPSSLGGNITGDNKPENKVPESLPRNPKKRMMDTSNEYMQ